jgi:hypothetical protein
VRQSWEDQKRFPLQLATTLSQQFASHGLQFFKVNKTVTHVSVARPHYLDLETTPVSEGVKRIVDFINAHTKTTRRKLMEALAPAPAPKTVIDISPTGVEAAPLQAPAAAEPSAEQTAVISDLHWLIHQGHVIEFADGRLETAKKPVPKPPKPEKKPAAPAAGTPAASEPAATGQAAAPDETAATSEVGGLPEAAMESVPAPSEPAPTNPDLLSVAEDVAAVTRPANEAPEPAAETPTEQPANSTEPQP